jgi:hypothetical protein
LLFIERKLKNNFVFSLEYGQKVGGSARSGLSTLCLARVKPSLFFYLANSLIEQQN